MTEKLWTALTNVIKLNDKVIALSNAMKEQQEKTEMLSERMIKLEVMLEILTQFSKNKAIFLPSALQE